MALSIDFIRDRAIKTIAESNSRSEWRGKAAAPAQMGRDLEDLSEAWYADATRAFPVGTPEGDTLRSTIPTTYTPPPDKPAPPPTPEPPKQG